jgi:hypothetical protein
MRASSLSNAKIIDLLNHYFVPVYADGVYVKHNPAVPADEKAAFERVFHDFYHLNQENKNAGKPQLSVGSVHAYVLSADGKPMDSLHVAQAKPSQVVAMLEKAVESLKVAKGEPIAKPAPQSAAPETPAGSVMLHLTARYLAPRSRSDARKDIDDEFVPMQPHLGEERSGQWSALPSEDWIALTKDEWTKLLPPGTVATGTSWNIPKEIAEPLLTRFYPTTENNDLNTNRFDRQELKATIVSINGNVARAKIEGSLKMKHTFYPHREDENFVDATILGYIDFAADKSRIETLRMATEKATYGTMGRFGVALRSVAAASQQ